MSVLTLVLPEVGQPDKTQDPKINTAFTAIQSWGNGQIDSSNTSATANQLFPKLLSARSVHLSYGSVAVNWGGATHIEKTVAHELTTSPAWVVGCCTLTAGGHAVATALKEVTGTNIVFFLENLDSAAAGSENTLFWAAIG
jgi:hypothetical protein